VTRAFHIYFMIRYDNTGQFIINRVKMHMAKNLRRKQSIGIFLTCMSLFVRREPLFFVCFHHISKQKKSAQLRYYRTDGRYLACIGKVLGHMVRPCMNLMNNSNVMFLDYGLQILSRLFPGNDSFRNPVQNLKDQKFKGDSEMIYQKSLLFIVAVVNNTNNLAYRLYF